jgi:hypothetical protein
LSAVRLEKRACFIGRICYADWLIKAMLAKSYRIATTLTQLSAHRSSTSVESCSMPRCPHTSIFADTGCIGHLQLLAIAESAYC